jgi:tetratricopeptide (TPR) repeat protein
VPFEEFITGIAFHQISYDYNAATRLSKLYYKFRKNEDVDLMTPLVTALLEAIAECGYPEDFINTIEQIQKDNLTPLQKRNLNEIGLIYLDLGQLDKAENILKYASSLIEAAYPPTKEIDAIIQWRLTLLCLTKNNIDGAISSYTKAATLSPNNFKKRDFVFDTKDEAIAYTDSNQHFQRLKIQNPEFAIRLYELSAKIQQHP